MKSFFATAIWSIVCLSMTAAVGGAFAATQDARVAIQSIREKTPQVRRLNDFVDALLRIHRHRLKTRSIRKSERVGGYANDPAHFRDIEYFDATSGRLLSRIRWENKPAGLPEVIEIYVYDRIGHVRVDYLATFLPGHRNAPFLALINIHDRGEGLRAFRQFDLSGDTLFERCEGTYRGMAVDLWLDETQLPPSPATVSEDLYLSCFGFLPMTPGEFIQPASQFPGLQTTQAPVADTDLTHDDVRRRIAETSRQIDARPSDARLYLKRGEDRFLLQQFDAAIADFTAAIRLDDRLDAAYFGRGMAHGRNRQLDEGIADLGVYIRRNPESSLAYTKRGVRYIWKEDFSSARRDLEIAISLDSSNAEAHDDLGVALAQLGKPAEAVVHFQHAVRLDPSYQKAHHNLALVLYLLGDLDDALRAIEGALRLQPENRGSVLVKSNILQAKGRTREANELRERAEFMTESTNWSERSALR